MICVRRSSPYSLCTSFSSSTITLAQHFLGAQHFQVFRDLPLDLGQFVGDLLLLHAGEALQLQLDDGLRLPLGELKRGDQRFARLARRARRADQPDDLIQIVQRLLEAQQDMLAFAGFAQSGNRCAGGPHPRGAR